MSFRVTLTLDVDALSEQEAFNMVERRLNTPDFWSVEFADAKEIDDTPGDSHLLESSGGGGSFDHRESWRTGG